MRIAQWCRLVLAVAGLWAPHAATAGTFVVTTTADSGAGSLRWAIEMVQAPGPDSIHFAIPESDPGFNADKGTWMIRPTSSFWALTDGETIVDGMTQAKYIGGDPNPHGPEIEINSEALTDLPVFCVLAPEVTFRGLTINRSKFSAIMFEGVQGGGVFGCYLGTTFDGMSIAGNQFGVSIHNESRDVVIGDSLMPQDGNLISGNEAGVFINGSCKHISVIGNRIGTNRTGSDTLGGQETGIAVYEYCDSVIICDNLIGGNRFGVVLANCIHGFVETNLIGTDEFWQCSLGNSVFGVLIADSARNNRVGNNAIANNGIAGIRIAGNGTVHNRLVRNLMTKNGQKGIRLEQGGNSQLSTPTILSTTTSVVSGVAGPGNTVEVFADSASEGRYYCGTAIAGAGGSFTLALEAPVVLPHVTATATDIAGNTSEFSVPYAIVPAGRKVTVTTTADSGFGSLRWAIEQSIVPGPDTIVFAIPTIDPGFNPQKGTWRIRPLNTLWSFTDGYTTVDGTSQARFVGGDPNPYGPEIEINADQLTASSALVSLAPDVVFKGLTVNRARYGAFQFNGAKGGGVFGCYLGTDCSGMSAAGNMFGAWILGDSRDISIGDSSAGGGNLIAGNQIGVLVQGASRGISVMHNRIGTNRNGTDTIGNSASGIAVTGLCDSVGIEGNLIGGSDVGIDIEESAHVTVAHNCIGTDEAWGHNLWNKEFGVLIGSVCHDNKVLDNVIGNCQKYGVYVASADALRNWLAHNSIAKNGKKGIAVTPGGNGGITTPAVVSVTAGIVSGIASPGNTVEIFADDSLQARYYIGSTKASGTGVFSLALGSPITQSYVTATATDSVGNTSELSEAFANGTTCVGGEAVAVGFALQQNYPNPFNPTTTIGYAVGAVSGQQSAVSWVHLAVYDLLGREVAVLLDEEKAPGRYQVEFDGAKLASGVFICRMMAGSYVQCRRMVLAK